MSVRAMEDRSGLVPCPVRTQGPTHPKASDVPWRHRSRMRQTHVTRHRNINRCCTCNANVMSRTFPVSSSLVSVATSNLSVARLVSIDLLSTLSKIGRACRSKQHNTCIVASADCIQSRGSCLGQYCRQGLQERTAVHMHCCIGRLYSCKTPSKLQHVNQVPDLQDG